MTMACLVLEFDAVAAEIAGRIKLKLCRKKVRKMTWFLALYTNKSVLRPSEIRTPTMRIAS
jgi:predicted nucleic acid-binding protein